MSENGGNRFKVIGIVLASVIVLGILGALWYFNMYKPEQEAKEKARQELLAKQAAEKKRQERLEQRRKKYRQLISNADSAYEQENWAVASSNYSEASKLFSKEQYPKDQLALVKSKLDELALLEARRKAGVVETVDSPSGNYYIIVSSSIDDDLALDYAKRLTREGKDVKVVKHDFDGISYYGVAVGEYASWEEATSATSSFEGSYDRVWVLKF